VSLAPAGAGRLLFGPAHWADAVAPRLRPSHVIVLRSPSEPPSTPLVPPTRLDLVFNDISEPRPGLIAPDPGAVGRLLAFAADWDGRAPLLVSCYAGVSRSTAAAYAIACLKRGAGAERVLADALRGASRSATPNALVVALADAALGRGGAMIEAVQAIGRGADCFEGEPVAWDLRTGQAHRAADTPSSTDASQSCSTAPSTSPV
jgi:predicted protein tyrosine phosphatase